MDRVTDSLITEHQSLLQYESWAIQAAMGRSLRRYRLASTVFFGAVVFLFVALATTFYAWVDMNEAYERQTEALQLERDHTATIIGAMWRCREWR